MIDQEAEFIIELMARAFLGKIEPDKSGQIFRDCQKAISLALRSAQEQGYVLARLPERKDDSHVGISHSRDDWVDEAEITGFNDCLESIETIRVDAP